MAYDILLGCNALVAGWVAAQMPSEVTLDAAVGFGAVRDRRLVGGIVFSEHRHPDIKVTVAGYGAWLSRRLLRTSFAYAFVDLDCRRITALVARGNAPSARLVERLGFTREGVHPGACADGATLYSYGLLRDDCRWLAEPQFRKHRRTGARHALSRQ